MKKSIITLFCVMACSSSFAASDEGMKELLKPATNVEKDGESLGPTAIKVEAFGIDADARDHYREYQPVGGYSERSSE